MKKLLYVMITLSLTGCRIGPIPPPPTTNYCSQLTDDDPANSYYRPVDCERLTAAIKRGIARYQAAHPEFNLNRVKPTDFNMKRGKLLWYPEVPYPLISSTGDDKNIVRAFAAPSGPLFFMYAYEESAEHEVIHLLGRSYELYTPRTQEAITNPLDHDQAEYPYKFQIYCHGTSDDPFGVRGDRGSCVWAYPDPAWSGYKP